MGYRGYFLGFCYYIIISFALISLSGCAINQSRQFEAKESAKGDALRDKKEELESRIVSSPMLITAEYFRERDPSNVQNKLSIFSIKGNTETKSDERIQKNEKRLTQFGERPKDAGGILLKRKVVILSLIGDTGLDVLAMLPTSLKRTRGIVPVDSSEFLSYLEKNGIKLEDLASQNTRREIANKLGIHAYILIYFQPSETIAFAENRNKLRIDVINATDNTLISSYFTTINEFDTLANNISEDVIKSTQWSSRVVYTEEKRVYINSGALSGVYLGDVFDVFSPGREIVDPLTGRILGILPGEFKGSIRIDELFGSDGAAGILISGSNISIGDIVRITKGTN